MTQAEAILVLLAHRGAMGLTPLDALELVGTMRLADRREPAAGVAAHNRSNLHRAWRAKLVEPSFDVRVKTR